MIKRFGEGKSLSFNIADDGEHERISKVCHALSVPDRLTILKFLIQKPKNLSDLSKDTLIPISSVSRHIDALCEAGLVTVNYQPGLKGQTKFCSVTALGIDLSLTPRKSTGKKKEYVCEMPVGLYSECSVNAPCGMTGETKNIVEFDNPDAFFAPERAKAECLWFDTGFVTYSFPAQFAHNNPVSELSFSLEICSETNYYNDQWPSDVTVSVNGVEVAIITTPGDFGGRRGRYTPKHWPVGSTQYGVLKTVTINEEGVFVDDSRIQTAVTISSLGIKKSNSIRFTLQVKKDARYRGGINVFGKNFGDYPQAIVMKMR